MRWGVTPNPLALLLLLSSLAIALAVEAWAPWSGRAPWVAGWGVLAYLAVAILARTPAPSPPPPPAAPGPGPDWTRLTEEALRHMHSPAALAAARLRDSLPRTLAAAAAGESGAAPDATPLTQARALRAVLEAAIEGLRQAGTAEAARRGDAAALAFAILHEEYVLGRPNTQIMTSHSISESTFHRHRREGIRLLADELARREQAVGS